MKAKGFPKVRYAVVGLGNIAQVAVLPAFENARRNSEVVALVSSDKDKLAELGERYGVREVGGYDELEVVARRACADAVYLATPNTSHRSFAERAARAGLHVLCEKPLATTVEDCIAIINACKAEGTKLMTAYRLHFEEGTLEALELVRSGKIGEPRVFSSVFGHQVRPGDIRTRASAGGGALFDLGVYCVNAARWVLGGEPYEVLACQVRGRDERSQEVDEMTTAILRFSDGRVAQLTATQGASDVDGFRVVGTRGDLSVAPAFTYHDDIRHVLTVGEETTRRNFPRRDQFAPELLHFSQCILDDREPEPSGFEGLADVRVLEAIVASTRRGRAVKLGEFHRAERPTRQLSVKKPPVKKPKTVHAPPPTK